MSSYFKFLITKAIPEQPILNRVGIKIIKIMNDKIAEVQTQQAKESYDWNLTLQEFNGECRIIYSTNCPLLCGGTINLYTTDGDKPVAAMNAAQPGGHFDTGKTWGTGWYAQWNMIDCMDKWIVMVKTPPTSN